jgi:Leucine-rich repeat (LRR) protein
MIPTKVFLLFLGSLLFSATLSNAQVACPFNRECTCSGNNPTATEFNSAECRPALPFMPNFVSPSIGAYTITGTFYFYRGVDKIQPRAFEVFKKIGWLQLELSETAKPLRAQWDFQAFQGPQVQTLSVSRLAGVLPPSGELNRLGANGLQSLIISNSGETVQLTDNAFAEFNSLTTLVIANTPISSFRPAAFAGLEKTLIELKLTSANLDTFPRDYIGGLTNLTHLDLSNNDMRNFQQSAFTSFVSLTNLILDGNDLNRAIIAKAFDNLPKSVITLFLENGGLTSIPSQIFQQNTQTTIISLADNYITSIRLNDFTPNTDLTYLGLSNNPINNIDRGSLQPLNRCQSLLLDNSQLSSFDLSSLNGMNELIYLGLVNSSKLTSVTVTDVGQVPLLREIDLMNSHLTYIDPDVAQIVSRKNFDRLDISENIDFVCDQNVNWIARYALCPDFQTHNNIQIRNTRCNSGRLLDEYLKEAVPNPCAAVDTTVVPTTSPTAPPGTGSTTPQPETQPTPPSQPTQPTGSPPTVPTGPTPNTTAPGNNTQPTVRPTTPKGASCTLANMFVVSGMAVLAAAMKLI